MGKRNCFVPSHLRDPAPPSVPFLRLMGTIRAEYGVFRLKKRASARLSAKVVPFFSYTGCFVILRFRARFPGFRHISVTLIFGTHCPPPRRFFPIIAQHFEFVNPENTIQNGFFYSGFTFFSEIRNLTVFSRNPRTLIIPQSVRLRRRADGSFVPKNRLSCRCPAARPVRPARSARNFPETKKIICPAHAAHVGHMTGDLVQSFPAPPDLPHRGRGTARRRWKEFVLPLRGYGKRGNHRLRTMGRAPLGLGD